MHITNLLFRLDIQRLRNTIQLYRIDRKKQQRILMLALSVGVFLWYYIFRPVSHKRAGVSEHWTIWRYVFPYALAAGASLFGSYARISRWLSRWSVKSWSVLPVESRPIAQWLIVSPLLWDSLWLVLGIIISIGLAVILKLNWLTEFPFLLLGAALLVAVVSMSKMLAVLILRYGSGRILLWPDWILKLVVSFLAIIFMQPLAVFWLVAEFGRQRGNWGITAAAIVILAGGMAALTYFTRALVVKYWHEIAVSFEFQQTHRKAAGRVPLADFLANRFRSPVTRIVTLFNLRSRNVMKGWVGSITVGGRRMHMYIAFFIGVMFLVVLIPIAAIHEGPSDTDNSMFIALFCGVWASAFAMMMIQQMFPVYRLLRMFPVSCIRWLWSISALPAIIAFFFLSVTSVTLIVFDSTTALKWIAAMLGIFLGIVPLRALALTAFPEATQTGEIVFMAVVAVEVLTVIYLSWIAVVPLMLGAYIYLYRKASREWRWREEGLHA